jgi:hypothetical protein
MTNIELRVVHPDRAATAERSPDQPLAQPRDGRDALGDQPAGIGQVERASRVEQQDDPELLGYLPGVHRQECPVCGARPLNHRRPRPQGPAGHRCHSFSQQLMNPLGQGPRSPTWPAMVGRLARS